MVAGIFTALGYWYPLLIALAAIMLIPVGLQSSVLKSGRAKFQGSGRVGLYL